ncbi:MAG: transglutaminase domain-containing protein [Bradymonadales bacterium]|nr:transglutaminase domain-containing protein [Bradymonadales bacterium]
MRQAGHHGFFLMTARRSVRRPNQPTAGSGHALGGVVAGLTCLVVAGLVWSQQPPEPILHEFFIPGPDEPVGFPVPLPDLLEEPAVGQPIHDGRGVELPGTTGSEREGEPPERGPDLFSQVLDHETAMEEWLDYFAVFDPSVAPFKRLWVLDGVRADAGEVELVTRESVPRLVALSEASVGEGVERFWGAIQVRLEPGVYIPIPSVAADMAIHQVIASQPVELEFYRDESDNYYVRSLSPEREEVVRLYYRVSAPREYFGGPLPDDSRLEEVPRDLRFGIPRVVVPVAREVAVRLGLEGSDQVARMVEGLAEYCRGFRAEPFPQRERSGDLFADIALSRRGTCRHRTVVFVVVAQAWGIPARYVANEAHAFAEVFFPGHGWRRIDLGGAAEGLRIHHTASRVLHFSAQAEQPPVETVASAGLGTGEGAEPSSGFEPPARPPDGEHSGTAREELGLSGEPWDLFDSAADTLDATTGLVAGEQAAVEREGSAAGTVRRVSVLRLEQTPDQAFRGESVEIEGRLLDGESRGLPGRRVAVLLGSLPGAQRPHRAIRLGWLVTGQDGFCSGLVTIPASLPLGIWDLYLMFEGDGEYDPSIGRASPFPQ